MYCYALLLRVQPAQAQFLPKPWWRHARCAYGKSVVTLINYMYYTALYFYVFSQAIPTKTTVASLLIHNTLEGQFHDPYFLNMGNLCLYICLSFCLSVCLSVCLSTICLSVCLFVCLSICLSWNQYHSNDQWKPHCLLKLASETIQENSIPIGFTCFERNQISRGPKGQQHCSNNVPTK